MYNKTLLAIILRQRQYERSDWLMRSHAIHVLLSSPLNTDPYCPPTSFTIHIKLRFGVDEQIVKDVLTLQHIVCDKDRQGLRGRQGF